MSEPPKRQPSQQAPALPRDRLSGEEPRLGGEAGQAARIVLLLRDLGGPNWRARRGAAEALGSCGLAAVPGLCAALAHADPDVRCRAARALGEIGRAGRGAARQVVPGLQGALADLSPVVREETARALGTIAEKWPEQARPAEAALVAAVRDPVGPVGQEAAWALRRFKKRQGVLRSVWAALLGPKRNRTPHQTTIDLTGTDPHADLSLPPGTQLGRR